MREIKFRGKIKSDGLWEFGSLWIDKAKYYINGTDNNWWEVIPDTVGQYTGLKDKNGVEIYEGDIVNAQYFGNLREWEWLVVEQIVFNDGAFMLKREFDDIEFYRPLMKMFQGIKLLSLEVIGNIYESKELLDKEV